MSSSQIVQPSYTTKLPSTGKTVQFRPFTVKEEKALLLALQDANIETVAVTIKNIVFTCTDGKVDPANVPYYDIEFIFLQIRSKSIGEIIELVGSCNCGPEKKTEFTVDIADTRIEPTPKAVVGIKIPDTPYTVEFRHPSLDDIVRMFHGVDDDASKTVASCILKVYTDDEVMDWEFEKKFDFVESMTTKQQRDIAAFLKDMPVVKLSTAFTCRHCGKVHDNTLSGFENFFV